MVNPILLGLLFLPPGTTSATLNYVGAGPTYGTKAGAVAAFSFPLGQGISEFNLATLTPTRKNGRISGFASTAGVGLSKSILDFRMGRDWSFSLPALATGGVTTSAPSTSSAFTAGFLPNLRWKHLTLGAGWITQTGAASGKLYGVVLGWVP